MREFSLQRCFLVCEGFKEYSLGGDYVRHPEDIRDICADMKLHSQAEEIVSMFTFNSRGALIGYHEISHGVVNASPVHPREVFKRALLENAASICLVHNHPSGDPAPSAEDREMTKRLVQAGRLMGVLLLDHLIISPDESFISLRSEESELFTGTLSLESCSDTCGDWKDKR